MTGSGPVRFGVLVSGRGSNMVALLEAARNGFLPADPAIVISNVAEAPALDRALGFGVEARAVPHRGELSREAHEEKLIHLLGEREVEWVCLAGYMRRLSSRFVERFRWRILNIHPSLLPAFPGLDAQRQALDFGVRVSGCTVHLVDEGLDTGPIVAQRVVAVADDDTVESLSARILEQEHQLYPEAFRRLLTHPWRIEGRRVRFEGA